MCVCVYVCCHLGEVKDDVLFFVARMTRYSTQCMHNMFYTRVFFFLFLFLRDNREAYYTIFFSISLITLNVDISFFVFDVFMYMYARLTNANFPVSDILFT